MSRAKKRPGHSEKAEPELYAYCVLSGDREPLKYRSVRIDLGGEDYLEVRAAEGGLEIYCSGGGDGGQLAVLPRVSNGVWVGTRKTITRGRR